MNEELKNAYIIETKIGTYLAYTFPGNGRIELASTGKIENVNFQEEGSKDNISDVFLHNYHVCITLGKKHPTERLSKLLDLGEVPEPIFFFTSGCDYILNTIREIGDKTTLAHEILKLVVKNNLQIFLEASLEILVRKSAEETEPDLNAAYPDVAEAINAEWRK